MQRLRHARVLARLVLAWFALTVGLALAAPVLQPQAAQWLCSGGGMKLVLPDGGSAAAAPTLDCPLCGAADAPGASPTAWQAHAIQPVPPAMLPVGDRHAAAAGLPPARGPPRAD